MALEQVAELEISTEYINLAVSKIQVACMALAAWAWRQRASDGAGDRDADGCD